jgi:3-hydroxyacyl-CoA dehydrogenase/enoyl-CoA hydratase/3-hydroxybutyryl-CoA epimerase/3-hydroxyacyl-CoA dehydrogenase/enoyl-CoA hydratase/3-hydroxybutyryl-CoA epimerase/enoyl-CoA isomerase
MSQPSTISVSMPQADIALLTIDMPGKSVNVLSSSVLEELSEQLDQLEFRNDLAGLIVCSGKPGSFIAGADLREFAASLDVAKEEIVAMCRRGQTLFGRLSKCPFVTVAAIDGTCLGGGAEVAVWCDRRILSDNPKTEFGFPEVKLGLFPAWGGTARLPRIIGLSNAVEMITSGQSIDARTAAAMDLACDVVPAERLLAAAMDVVRDEQRTQNYLQDRQRWRSAIDISETELGFLGATASALIRQQTKGQYPAPEAALEVMLESAMGDVEAACQNEAHTISELFGSPVNAALLNVFFLTDRVKKDTGVDRRDVKPREIRSVGVIGAGIMGAGIAAANLKRKVPVTITDAAEDALAKGVQTVLEEAAYNKQTKGPDVKRIVELGPLLNISKADAELAACDLIVEAVVENADVKRQIYARLEPKLAAGAILASNTSTIPITRLAEQLERPEQFCGIHFFNPVRQMQLVEVIRGAKTSDQTIVTAVAYAKRIGKMPIVVNDGPGFLVNRLLLPYMNEALELICEGAEIKQIEKAATRFGMPMGPIALYDMVGLDTALYAGRTMWEAFPERTTVSPLLLAMVKAGRLGQKTGSGFFSYKNRKKRAEPDPEFTAFAERYVGQQKKFTEDELTARLFLPMLLEATRVLQDNIVRDPRDVDFGLIFGLGFPAFKGGLLFWADTVGADKILQMLEPLEHLGERSRPTPMLLEMAQNHRKFYQQGS